MFEYTFLALGESQPLWPFINILMPLRRDTVSSIGMIRGKSLPVTNTYNDGICYFRHALALDERRVKFLPEYVCGGDTYEANRNATPNTSPTNAPTERENHNKIAGADYVVSKAPREEVLVIESTVDCQDANGDRNQIMGKTSDRVKEVWFAGCHSDMSIDLLYMVAVY